MDLKNRIQKLFSEKKESYTAADYDLFNAFIEQLNSGKLRACEPCGDNWVVNEWVKMGILLGFRVGKLTEMPEGSHRSFFDKHTLPERRFKLADRLRIVPGGTSVRNGAYLAPGVTVMPPAFVNVGAFVDSDTLIDSHALVGSCAQIGKRVHLSAGAMIGGVLEPIGLRPVVVEDDVFIGGNCGIYEGIRIGRKAVIASGTIITASTPVYDSVHQCFLCRDQEDCFSIPEKAVVVAGSRTLKNNPGFQVYCPIIIKYRDEKTDISVQLEQDLRDATS